MRSATQLSRQRRDFPTESVPHATTYSITIVCTNGSTPATPARVLCAGARSSTAQLRIGHAKELDIDELVDILKLFATIPKFLDP